LKLQRIKPYAVASMINGVLSIRVYLLINFMMIMIVFVLDV
jgi:hypothetical protein